MLALSQAAVRLRARARSLPTTGGTVVGDGASACVRSVVKMDIGGAPKSIGIERVV